MAVSATWPQVKGIAFGGDYNPEQWPRATWDEDVRLMREAGVNLVSVAIFSWALIEPREGEFDFGWLDEAIELLHANGIAVDVGTPTASPPAWFFAKYPEARVTDKNGVIQGFGSRGQASHASADYRAACVRIAGKLAERYGSHPAVVMWHVHNEFGVPVGEDHGPASVGRFREWLRDTYGELDALNDAWGTAFWGQHYEDWEHINSPAAAPSTLNPAQVLDWARFTDDQLRACFRAERDAIRAHAPQPITTNLMANQAFNTDLWKWAAEVDVVSNDHYLTAADADNHIGLAIAADLTRSLAAGKPWILMEHSTSAVNWQPRNVAKRPGEMARNSFSHFARGADAVLFFQWRASRSGAEKFHSAMLPHTGTESRVWREVVSLGEQLGKLEEVAGTRTVADVAILWDTESFWAQSLDWRPSVDLTWGERLRAYYERMWRDGLTVDFVHPSHDLSKYPLVVAPAQYLLSEAAAANIAAYVRGGGTLLASCFSGVVDEHDAVHPGGLGAALAEPLGLVVDEFLPLREGERHAVTFEADGSQVAADVWQEDLLVRTASTVATYASGPAEGKPAITRNESGEGVGWYVSTRLDVAALAPVLTAVYADAGIVSRHRQDDLEIVTRRGNEADYVFAINHGDASAEYATAGTDMLSGRRVEESVDVPAGGIAVVRVERVREGGDRTSTVGQGPLTALVHARSGDGAARADHL